MDRYMMNIKRIFLFSTILASFNAMAVEKLTVYRWVDENNIVHFSQNQPAHDNYTEISMATNKKSSALLDKSNSSDTPTPEESNKTDLAANEVVNDKCDIARQNLSTLKGFDKIQYKDAQGNLKVLSDKEKKNQLAMNTKQVEVYCTDE